MEAFPGLLSWRSTARAFTLTSFFLFIYWCLLNSHGPAPRPPRLVPAPVTPGTIVPDTKKWSTATQIGLSSGIAAGTQGGSGPTASTRRLLGRDQSRRLEDDGSAAPGIRKRLEIPPCLLAQRRACLLLQQKAFAARLITLTHAVDLFPPLVSGAGLVAASRRF
jgi:hypothetical protein